MENRIKEAATPPKPADRTSAGTMRANQVRLFFSSIAYVLLNALRRLGLAGTELACSAVPDDPAEAVEGRGALESAVTVRRVWVHLASGCPYAELFQGASMQKLSGVPPIVLRC